MLLKTVILIVLIDVAVVKKDTKVSIRDERRCERRYLGDCKTESQCESIIGEKIKNGVCGYGKLYGDSPVVCCPIYYGWAKCNDTPTTCSDESWCLDHLSLGRQDCPEGQVCCHKEKIEKSL